MLKKSATSLALRSQFETPDQQSEAARLGMWIFIATEVLFFGALFLSLSFYRYLYPAAFDEGAAKLNLFIGTVNTAILLTSSLTMVRAVAHAKAGENRRLSRALMATAALGVVFLILKGVEYRIDFTAHLVPALNFDFSLFKSSKTELFFLLYFGMTGLHALHLIIGIGIVFSIWFRARSGRFNQVYYTPVEIGGLYWHFIDLVWIFLFPILYLSARS